MQLHSTRTYSRGARFCVPLMIILSVTCLANLAVQMMHTSTILATGNAGGGLLSKTGAVESGAGLQAGATESRSVQAVASLLANLTASEEARRNLELKLGRFLAREQQRDKRKRAGAAAKASNAMGLPCVQSTVRCIYVHVNNKNVNLSVLIVISVSKHNNKGEYIYPML